MVGEEHMLLDVDDKTSPGPYVKIRHSKSIETLTRRELFNRIFPSPSRVRISKQITLTIMGDVVVETLQLVGDGGCLILEAVPRTIIVVRSPACIHLSSSSNTTQQHSLLHFCTRNPCLKRLEDQETGIYVFIGHALVTPTNSQFTNENAQAQSNTMLQQLLQQQMKKTKKLEEEDNRENRGDSDGDTEEPHTMFQHCCFAPLALCMS